jgi:1-acyl-sn-glycerol-3-phosphate acyltransferase
MIRRSVRTRFHTVYWEAPSFDLTSPVIFVPNHHGWFDGYLMFHVVSKLGIPTLDWIQEFDAFPLFAKVGGMAYPAGDATRRARTVKRTIRLMREQGWSLLLFAESHLHYPPDLLEFGRALETIVEKVPDVQIVPVAIQYEAAMHERPEAFIRIGSPIEKGADLLGRVRDQVQRELEVLHRTIREPNRKLETLVTGTRDVNERLDMRRLGRRKQRL